MEGLESAGHTLGEVTCGSSLQILRPQRVSELIHGATELTQGCSGGDSMHIYTLQRAPPHTFLVFLKIPL